MVSIRNPLALACLIAVTLSLSGCVDTMAQSKQLAFDGASGQITKLQARTTQLTEDASSAQDVLAKIQSGDLGIVFPARLPSDSVLPGPTFTAIYDAALGSDAVMYSAVVEATGESGGGGTYKQTSIFVCVDVTSSLAPDNKTSISQTRCRDDILEALLKLSNNKPVKLTDIPAIARSLDRSTATQTLASQLVRASRP